MVHPFAGHQRAGRGRRAGAVLPSLTANTAMRLDDLASVLDEDCMHAYPLYCDVARSFLVSQFVPFACALTAEWPGAVVPR